MAEMRGLAVGGGTFGMPYVMTGQVLFREPDLVHCDFPDDDEPDGGAGRFTIWDDSRSSHVEVYGSVRHLTPLLRQITEAFEARLKELPDD